MQRLFSASTRGTRPAAVIVAALAGRSSRRALSMPSSSSSIAPRPSKPASSSFPSKRSAAARWTASRGKNILARYNRGRLLVTESIIDDERGTPTRELHDHLIETVGFPLARSLLSSLNPDLFFFTLSNSKTQHKKQLPPLLLSAAEAASAEATSAAAAAAAEAAAAETTEAAPPPATAEAASSLSCLASGPLTSPSSPPPRWPQNQPPPRCSTRPGTPQRSY